MLALNFELLKSVGPLFIFLLVTAYFGLQMDVPFNLDEFRIHEFGMWHVDVNNVAILALLVSHLIPGFRSDIV